MRKMTEAGIDVSKAVLDIALRRDGERLETARFDNDATGHKRLTRWLTKGGRPVRVVLESTGTYSLDVAPALHRTRGVAAWSPTRGSSSSSPGRSCSGRRPT